MSFEWNQWREDVFLNLVLKADSDVEFQRAMVKFGQVYKRIPAIALREGEQYLRRRANRRTDYVGPWRGMQDIKIRECRAGNTWSWAEQRVLDWAMQKDNSESKQEVTVEYLARLFQRSVTDVETEIKRRSTEKHGIKGFPL
jgi:hypothetical protein